MEQYTLTAVEVKAATATVKADGRVVANRLRDGAGLMLLCKPSGRKSWVLRMAVGGKRRDLGLGSYPAVSLAEARRLAAERRSAASAGQLPANGRLAAPAAVPTFAEVADKVLAVKRLAWTSAKEPKIWQQRLDKHVLPALGAMPIDAIERRDVLDVLLPIWSTVPETGRRIRGQLNAIFRWAMANEYIDINPAGEVIEGALPSMARRAKHFRSLPYEEVSRALEAVDSSTATITARLCLRFLVLTAARSGEAREATWDEIDLDGREWRVPASRSKTRREHRVPLSAPGLVVLEVARTLRDSSGLVFPSLGKTGRPMTNMTLTEILRRVELDGELLSERGTVHGFRTSFKTWAMEQTDAPVAVSEAALAHSLGNGVERAYARTDLFERRRELMEQWGAYVTGDVQ